MRETGGYYEQYPERKEISRNRLTWLIDEFCNSSQAEFAKKTGLQRSTVSMYLSGKNVLGIRNASKIGHIFGVNRDWLRGDPNASISRDSNSVIVPFSKPDPISKENSDQRNDEKKENVPLAEWVLGGSDMSDYYQLAEILYAYTHADAATQWAIKNLLGIKSDRKEDATKL